MYQYISILVYIYKGKKCNIGLMLDFSGDAGFCVICCKGFGQWTCLPCFGVWRGAFGRRHYDHWTGI